MNWKSKILLIILPIVICLAVVAFFGNRIQKASALEKQGDQLLADKKPVDAWEAYKKSVDFWPSYAKEKLDTATNYLSKLVNDSKTAINSDQIDQCLDNLSNFSEKAYNWSDAKPIKEKCQAAQAQVLADAKAAADAAAKAKAAAAKAAKEAKIAAASTPQSATAASSTSSKTPSSSQTPASKKTATVSNWPPQKPAPFITAAPIDFSDFYRLSKFRSCRGHDYSFWTLNGNETSTGRSNKNYFEYQVKDAPVYAPFDGTVTRVGGVAWDGTKGTWWAPTGVTAWQDWNVRNGHIRWLPGFDKVGAKFKAGQQIGLAGPKGVSGGNIDLSVEYIGDHYLTDSIFNYMTPAVLSKFAAHGVALEDIIIPKAKADARDACDFTKWYADDMIVFK